MIFDRINLELKKIMGCGKIDKIFNNTFPVDTEVLAEWKHIKRNSLNLWLTVRS